MVENQPPVIGRNIMNYRKLKNMSLEELSKRSGVSKSMLSQIEQEKTNPTVITVWKIARALDITVEDLLETGGDYQIEVLRSNDAPLIHSEDDSCTFRINSPVHMSDNLELYQVILKPWGKHVSSPHYPKTEEFLTVISGKFKITAGNHASVLQQGDTARYRADCPHSLENLGEEMAEGYLVVLFAKPA